MVPIEFNHQENNIIWKAYIIEETRKIQILWVSTYSYELVLGEKFTKKYCNRGHQDTTAVIIVRFTDCIINPNRWQTVLSLKHNESVTENMPTLYFKNQSNRDLK